MTIKNIGNIILDLGGGVEGINPITAQTHTIQTYKIQWERVWKCAKYWEKVPHFNHFYGRKELKESKFWRDKKTVKETTEFAMLFLVINVESIDIIKSNIGYCDAVLVPPLLSSFSALTNTFAQQNGKANKEEETLSCNPSLV